jgi:hypothetical protein
LSLTSSLIDPEAQIAPPVEAQAEAAALVRDELAREVGARGGLHPGFDAELGRVEARCIGDRYVSGRSIERNRSLAVTPQQSENSQREAATEVVAVVDVHRVQRHVAGGLVEAPERHEAGGTFDGARHRR